jgi:hypothetical protein
MTKAKRKQIHYFEPKHHNFKTNLLNIQANVYEDKNQTL